MFQEPKFLQTIQIEFACLYTLKLGRVFDVPPEALRDETCRDKTLYLSHKIYLFQKNF